MENEREDVTLSAQVVLRSASGKSLDPNVPITSENIGEYAPDPFLTRIAQDAFADAGFEVGEMVGISFAITAPATHFEEFFGTQFERSKTGEIQATGDNGYELPRENLPASIAELVVTVTFSPPVDFGPIGFLC